jgi:hypothetical protein
MSNLKQDNFSVGIFSPFFAVTIPPSRNFLSDMFSASKIKQDKKHPLNEILVTISNGKMNKLRDVKF